MSKRYPGVFRPWYRDKKTGQRKQTATWFIRYSVRGRLYRERTGTTLEKEAWDLRVRRLHEAQQGRLIGPKAERLRLEDLERMVKDALAGRPSQARVAYRFRALRSYFGQARVLDITPADLSGYKAARLAAGGAAGTIAVELAHLHRGYSIAVASHLLPAIPAFPEIKVENARRVFLERAQLDALWPHLPEYLRPILRTALLTGWRRRAILSRQRAHVDLVNRWLYLDPANSKSGEPVQVPLIPALLDVLREQDERARAIELRTGRIVPWCFFYLQDTAQTRAGARIKNFDHAWDRATAAAGLGHLHFHDLRRGAIRTLRRAGLSEHEIMDWVGLKTREVFDRYDVLDEERKREAGARLQAFLEKPAEPQPVVPFAKKP